MLSSITPEITLYLWSVVNIFCKILYANHLDAHFCKQPVYKDLWGKKSPYEIFLCKSTMNPLDLAEFSIVTLHPLVGLTMILCNRVCLQLGVNVNFNKRLLGVIASSDEYLDAIHSGFDFDSNL